MMVGLGVGIAILGFASLAMGLLLHYAGHRLIDLWPAGPWPDDDPTLDVQNHHGDARPTGLDRVTTYRRWRAWERER
jgi:hypothetical protein